MEDMPKRKKKSGGTGVPEYMATYGDMVTLLLCFFALLINPASIDKQRLELIMSTFNKIGVLNGGNTLESGDLVELGNNLMTLPSTTPLRQLDKARKESLEIIGKTKQKNNKTVVTQSERGLVISLAGDMFFKPKSAELNIEEARPTLRKLAQILTMPTLKNRKFRIEGRTNSIPPPEDSTYRTNWELSTARSNVILHRLSDLGVNEKQFQVVGLADTENKGDDPTSPENEKVDIIILRSGHI